MRRFLRIVKMDNLIKYVNELYDHSCPFTKNKNDLSYAKEIVIGGIDKLVSGETGINLNKDKKEMFIILRTIII